MFLFLHSGDIFLFVFVNQAEVSHEEAAKFAEENGLHFIETSAKTGQNVEDAFLKTAQLIFQNIEDVRYDLLVVLLY